MNILSWLLLAAVLLWFIAALVRVVRRRGGCSCGSSSSCNGNCASCSKCRHD